MNKPRGHFIIVGKKIQKTKFVPLPKGTLQ